MPHASRVATRPRPSADERRVARRERRRQELDTQPKVTGKFVGQDLREVLANVGAEAGVSIVLASAAQSTVDIRFDRTPLEQALDLLLFPVGFVYAKRGDTSYVCGPADPSVPGFAELSVSRTIRTNAPAEEVAMLLPEHTLRPFVQASGKGHVLVVSAPESLVSRILDMIEDIDAPKTQFEIEVIVSSIERTCGDMLGDKRDPLRIALHFESNKAENPTASVAEGWGYAAGLTGDILGSLQFLEQRGKAIIHANPRVVALDGEQAELSALQEYYVPIAGSLVVNPTVEVIKAGVRMQVTASLQGSDEILLAIEPEVADVVGIDPSNALPIISRRSVKTTVRLRDGECLVLGGLYQSVRRIDRTRTPGVGEVPFLSPLFASKEMKLSDAQLVLFITPRIVRQ